MTGNQRSAVEQLIAEGMAQVQGGATLAKAAQDQLDKDFKPLTDAQAASDAAQDDDEDGIKDSEQSDDQGDGAKEDADTDDSEQGDDQGDTESDDDDQGEGEVAKADGDFIDAMPLLEALDQKLGVITDRLGGVGLLFDEVNALKGVVGKMAKAIEDQASGTLLIAKAVSPHLDAPLPPKSKVRVPTAQAAPATITPSAFFAKAEQAMSAGKLGPSDISLLNAVVNSKGVDGARSALPQLTAIVEAQ